MIKLSESVLLAYTKLRTRKIRLIVTIVVSCLLFSGLASASLVFRGLTHGVDKFSSEGFSDKFILMAIPANSSKHDLTQNQSLIDKAIAENKTLIDKKKAEAKRLDITYDPASEPLPYQEFEGSGGKERQLNLLHPIAKKIINEYAASQPKIGKDDLKKSTEPYHPVDFYESKKISINTGVDSFTVKILKEGKEDYSQNNKNHQGPPLGFDTFETDWQLASQGLIKPFVLPGSSMEIKEDGAIPVIAPFSAAEQLLGLKPLEKSADSQKKLERLKIIRDKAASISFKACFRNSTSANEIYKASQIQEELIKNKTNKAYQKPSLILDYPTVPCGPLTTVSDKRTADEKKLEEKQTEFNRKFGEPVAVSKLLNFRVIGLAPDPPDFAAFGITDVLTQMLTSTLGPGWYSPIEISQSDPVLQQIFSEEKNFGFSANLIENDLFVNFDKAENAKKFVNEKNCQPDFDSFPNPASGSSGQQYDPYAKCVQEGKLFTLEPFGSSSLALTDIKATFNKFFRIAAIVIAVIAGVIMMGTLGRIIADSRRETAVFRAIGAKKLDIAQIYLTYVFMLSVMIAAAALLIGIIIASLADSKYSDDITLAALIAYNAQDLTREIHLYGIEIRDMLYIVGFTIMAGFVGAILPLLTSLRRNPINDMRDEN